MMTTFRRFSGLVAAIAAITMANKAHGAEFKVSSATFQPTDGSISIAVHLDNNSNAVLSLAAFSFQLQVSGTGTGRVEFDSTTQPNSLTDPNYIFFGNSAAQTTPSTPWALNSVSGGVNNDFVFTDTTDDTLNVNVAANASKLLANIILKPASGAAAPQSGDVYTLAFVSAGTSIFDDTLNSISFTTGTGTLTVPIPAPEPSTFSMASVAVVMLLMKLCPKRKRWV